MKGCSANRASRAATLPFPEFRALVVAAVLLAILTAGGCASARSFEPTSRSRVASASHIPPKGPAGEVTTPERFLSHVAHLAHDHMEGRGPGTDGVDLAAGYIAGQFAAAGVAPGGPDGSYFQSFKIRRKGLVMPETKLEFAGTGVEPKLHEDFRPLGISSSGDFEGAVVFAGYGIVNPDRGHDDYANVDVRDKVVLALRREPRAWRDGGRPSAQASFSSKAARAAERGARALLIVNQKPEGDAEDVLAGFEIENDSAAIPVVHVKRSLADALLTAGGLRTLDELEADIAENNAVVASPLQGVMVTGTVSLSFDEVAGRNVIGMLRGNGMDPDDFVVLGAHYDHLGIRRGNVYNGADDNASGTAGLIELAHAFSETTRRERSLLFIAFGAEELGLIGSKHFASSPTVPVERIKAMLNMDMIGRLDHDRVENQLAVHGLGTGLSFRAIVNRHVTDMGIPIVPDESALGPSDHQSFYEVGVPSLFFFTGVHADYHAPGDDVEKVNAIGGSQVTQLVYRIACDILNAEEAPVYAQVSTPARIIRSADLTPRVVLGIAPDMDDASPQPGIAVAGVAPGLGADKAGIKPGDRLLSVDGVMLNDASEIFKSLSGKKSGDMVQVRIRRGADELDLQIELSARGG